MALQISFVLLPDPARVLVSLEPDGRVEEYGRQRSCGRTSIHGLHKFLVPDATYCPLVCVEPDYLLGHGGLR